MRWWPRTVRWQLILWLMLLEVLSVALFAVVLVNIEGRKIRRRAVERLAHQATSVSLQAEEAYRQQRPELVLPSLRMMGEAPSVAGAKITDAAGNVLLVSSGEPTQTQLDPAEKAQIARVTKDEPLVFSFGNKRFEGVKAIYDGEAVRGYAWVETDRSWDTEELDTVLRSSFSFGLIWIGASALLVLLLSRSISRPLGILQGATRALMEGEGTKAKFPLPVKVDNEFGDLIQAFNRMVAALEEQRSGLNDTLSLLDSMLANAPIGLVFFDRQSQDCARERSIRDDDGGRTEPSPGADAAGAVAGADCQAAGRCCSPRDRNRVDRARPGACGATQRWRGPWTWLVTAYPVRPTPERCAVGGRDRDRRERTKAQRRCVAPNRKAGGDGASCGFNRA